VTGLVPAYVLQLLIPSWCKPCALDSKIGVSQEGLESLGALHPSAIPRCLATLEGVLVVLVPGWDVCRPTKVLNKWSGGRSMKDW